MCGRFAVGETDGVDWADWLGLDTDLDWPAANWNVAPTQTVGIVTGQGLRHARWGLIPRWWKKPLSEFRATTFNARSEEAAGKPMFRDAWARRRCLIPALGYYEWTGKAKAKTPWFIQRRGNAPGLCMAGLWAEAVVDGTPVVSCTVLTTAAGAATAHLHPRSPVIVDEADWAGWLSDGRAPMVPVPDDRVDIREVGSAVGNVRNNGPDLLAPASLF